MCLFFSDVTACVSFTEDEHISVFLLVSLHPVMEADNVNAVLENLTLKYVFETGTVQHVTLFRATVLSKPHKIKVGPPFHLVDWCMPCSRKWKESKPEAVLFLTEVGVAYPIRSGIGG